MRLSALTADNLTIAGEGWTPWYAWRPVRLSSGGWAWRRLIVRRWVFNDYRNMRRRVYADPFMVALSEDGET